MTINQYVTGNQSLCDLIDELTTYKEGCKMAHYSYQDSNGKWILVKILPKQKITLKDGKKITRTIERSEGKNRFTYNGERLLCELVNDVFVQSN